MIHYRLATPDDNEQLMTLTSATGVMGEVSLRIERRPDFFRLLHMRGESKVFVALDGCLIIGSLSVSTQQVFVGGEVYPLQYIADFKVAEAYRNKSVGTHLCSQLADYVVSIDADLAFLNVSYGNEKPFSFFRNRPGFPDFDNIGIFNMHQFIGRRNRMKPFFYTVECGTLSDELLTFLNAHSSGYELGPVISEENMRDTEVFIIRHHGQMKAAMCLMDTMHAKQNIVIRLSRRWQWLIRALNVCYSISGMSRMPSLHTPIRMLHVMFLAAQDNDFLLARTLLDHARHIVYERGYSFVSIGMHERDPLHACTAGMFKLTFRSVGMLVSLKNNRHMIGKVINGVPFKDFTLV